jgi:hypothetical protein
MLNLWGAYRMFARTLFLTAASIAATSAMPAAASAEVLKFHVALDGHYGPEPTGSPATGTAKVQVDTVTHRVSVDLDVNGITIDDLWDTLVRAPIGPIHFHKYANAAGGDSVLALPLPFGPNYHAEKWGLKVRMKNYDYVAGVTLVKSTLSFDDFVAGMKSGLIVLNVHTDQFNPGEISGLVVPN